MSKRSQWSFIVSLCGVFAWSSPAAADWQYTNWGMTLDQVLAASKGSLKRCDEMACKGQTTDKAAAHLFGSYRTGEFSFTAFAMFDKSSNKLSFVNLRLNDPKQSHSLVGALRGKYGEPSSTSRTQITQMWVWREQKDQISVFMIGSGSDAMTTLGYQPRLNESNKGL